MQNKAKNSSKSIVTVLAGFLMSSACTGELFVFEGVSAAVSDKTVSDHVVSLLSGKDCSFLRVDQGRTYCVEDEEIISQSHLYCYSTLGSVMCYNEPDPQRAESERLGFIDQSQSQP